MKRSEAPGGLNTGRLSQEAGLHACLGAWLARMEAEAALAALSRRLINPSLAEDPPSYRSTDVVRGPERLLIKIEAKAKILVVLAVGIETVGVGKSHWIAVSRGHKKNHHGAFGNANARDVEVVKRFSSHEPANVTKPLGPHVEAGSEAGASHIRRDLRTAGVARNISRHTASRLGPRA
jgi:hypothetical protein